MDVADFNIYELFETDDDKEAGEGIKLYFGPKIWIKIHRAGGANKNFAKVWAAKMRPYERDRSLGKLAEPKALKLAAEAYAEAVILDWDGITDRDGNELAFTKENVVKVMTDLPELFLEVRTHANTYGNFLVGKRELAGEGSGGGSEPTLTEVTDSAA